MEKTTNARLIDNYDLLLTIIMDLRELALTADDLTEDQRGDVQAAEQRCNAALRSIKICVEDRGERV